MTFFNENRAADEVKKHIHESPKTMTLPLILLAVLSAIGGYLGIPHALGGSNLFHHYLDPVVGLGQGKLLQASHDGVLPHGADISHAAAQHPSMLMEYLLMGISVAIALIGIYMAYMMYIKNRELPEKLANRFPLLYRLLLNKWYVDELYSAVIIRPIQWFSNFLWKVIDVSVIDWIVNTIARVVGWLGNMLRYIQSGQVQSYAISVVLGTVVLLIYYLRLVL